MENTPETTEQTPDQSPEQVIDQQPPAEPNPFDVTAYFADVEAYRASKRKPFDNALAAAAKELDAAQTRFNEAKAIVDAIDSFGQPKPPAVEPPAPETIRRDGTAGLSADALKILSAMGEGYKKRATLMEAFGTAKTEVNGARMSQKLTRLKNDGYIEPVGGGAATSYELTAKGRKVIA